MAPVAYSYARFSSAAQAQGDSLRRQLAASRAYADAHGLALDTSLRDAGVSAYSGSHRKSGSALSSFLAKIADGKVAPGSYLLIDSFDRLTRQRLSEALNLFTGIVLADVKVVTLNDGQVYDREADMMQLMFALMQFTRAHEESAEKGRKVAEARAEGRRRAREELTPFTKMGPHWLELVADPEEPTKKIWREIPERVAVVRRIFRMKEEGLGHSSVAAQLNSEGVPAPRSKSGWTEATVGDLIKSRTVLGEYQPGRTNEPGKRRVNEGEPIEGFYPRIIEDEQFNRVEAIVAARRNINARPRSKSFPNLLVGLVKCESCGGTAGYLRSTFPKNPNWRARGVIRCNRVYTGLCNNRSRIPYDTIEAGLLDFVARVPLGGRSSSAPNDLLMAKKAELEVVKLKVEALLDQVEAGTSVGGRLRERELELARLEDEVQSLQATVSAQQPAISPDDARDLLRRLNDELRSAEGDELYAVRARINETLRRVVNGFVLSRDERLIVRVNPENIPSLLGSWRLPADERPKPFFISASDASGGYLRWEFSSDHDKHYPLIPRTHRQSSDEAFEEWINADSDEQRDEPS